MEVCSGVHTIHRIVLPTAKGWEAQITGLKLHEYPASVYLYQLMSL